ncbi:MAG: MFS transporter [Moorellales bacterium]
MGKRPAREPIWTRDFCLVCFSSFLIHISMHMLMPVLPGYVRSWGVGEGLAGAVTGAFAISALATRPVTGRELDRRERRPVYLTGLALFVVAAFAYPWAYNPGSVLGTRVLQGCGFGIVSTAAGTIITDLLPPKRRGEGMGYFGLFNSISTAVAPATGIYLASNLGYYCLFYAAAALAVAALLLAAGLSRGQVVSHRTETYSRLAIFEPGAAPASLVALFVSVAYSSVVTFIQIYASMRGIANVGVFFTVYATVMIAIRSICGRIYDLWGPTPVVAPGLVLMAGSLTLIAHASGLKALIVAAVLLGLGFGAAQPSLQALAVAKVPPTRRGAANANFYSALDIGLGGGSVLFGLVAEMVGYPSMYQTAATVPLGGIGVYLLMIRFWRNTEDPKNMTVEVK